MWPESTTRRACASSSGLNRPNAARTARTASSYVYFSAAAAGAGAYRSYRLSVRAPSMRAFSPKYDRNSDAPRLHAPSSDSTVESSTSLPRFVADMGDAWPRMPTFSSAQLRAMLRYISASTPLLAENVESSESYAPLLAAPDGLRTSAETSSRVRPLRRRMPLPLPVLTSYLKAPVILSYSLARADAPVTSSVLIIFSSGSVSVYLAARRICSMWWRSSPEPAASLLALRPSMDFSHHRSKKSIRLPTVAPNLSTRAARAVAASDCVSAAYRRPAAAATSADSSPMPSMRRRIESNLPCAIFGSSDLRRRSNAPTRPSILPRRESIPPASAAPSPDRSHLPISYLLGGAMRRGAPAALKTVAGAADAQGSAVLFVHIAPAPAPIGQGLHYGVPRLLKVLCRVAPRRRVAAADVSAREAHPHGDPGRTVLEALFAPVRPRLYPLHGLAVVLALVSPHAARRGRCRKLKVGGAAASAQCAHALPVAPHPPPLPARPRLRVGSARHASLL